MDRCILQVASPFAAVGPGAPGGAEQTIHVLDRALVEAGHRSIVVAPEGSEVAGQLVATPAVIGPVDAIATVQARTQMRLAVRRAIDLHRPQLVHLHAADFLPTIPEGIPVVASLHRDPRSYADEVFAGRRGTVFQCVAREQIDHLPDGVRLLSPNGRGVSVPERRPAHARRSFALYLGRIAPEKGVHLAIEAARHADRPLLVAGAPSGRPEDAAYLQAEILPRLDARRRLLGLVDPDRKRRLLAAARCLLVPNLADGYSGLAVREALAAGTPVVGFRTGALPSLVTHGHTGFLVDGVEDMAAAMDVIEVLDGEDCRTVARTRFSLEVMIDRAFQAYEGLIGQERQSIVA